MKNEQIEALKEDPQFQLALEAAHKSGMGIKQAQDFILNYVTELNNIIPPAPEIDFDEEKKKLGDNADVRVNRTGTWLNGLKEHGDITENEYNALLRVGQTADGISVIEKLMHKTGVINPPVSGIPVGNMVMSQEDWYNYSSNYEENKQQGETYEQFHERCNKMGEKIFGKGSGTFSGAGINLSN
jgi:hypothetical protein